MFAREVAAELAKLFKRKEVVLSGTFQLSESGVHFVAAPGTRAQWFDEWFSDLRPILRAALDSGYTLISVDYDGSYILISVGSEFGSEVFRYKF